MSHFSVLVVTNEYPTTEVLHKTLLPWHEYECTGYEEYLVDVDMTDEVTEEFNRPRNVVVLADGKVLSRYDTELYTKKSGDGWLQRDEFELPAGAVEKEIPAEEARSYGIGFMTMADCAKDDYGATENADGRFYRRTNPNKKWDWWVVGGRYLGRLLVKELEMAVIGEPGTGGNDPLNVMGVDSCQFKNLDLAQMRDNAEERAADQYDRASKIIAGRSFLTWKQVRDKHTGDIEAAREEYNSQPVVQDSKTHERIDGEWIFDPFEGPDEFSVSRENYIAEARANALTAFAVVKDGKWYEKGEMGWWGIVSDEKDNWKTEFSALIDDIDPKSWITVVDCHI